MNEPRKPPWLTLVRGSAPLILSVPHAGTELPASQAGDLVSTWLARKDTDWWVDRLYDFASALGATLVRTSISRTIIDVNRDPSGKSLYPGLATTDLCPATTFDGEPLYADGRVPEADEVAARRAAYFAPYHATLEDEIARLQRAHGSVIVYDCHSIRSVIPRLFPGELPIFNIGTYDGASCPATLASRIQAHCVSSGFACVVNGRFKGGYTTRHYGRPARDVHAIQMELACRGYLKEPRESLSAANWPPAYDEATAAPMRAILANILQECLRFAAGA